MHCKDHALLGGKAKKSTIHYYHMSKMTCYRLFIVCVLDSTNSVIQVNFHRISQITRKIHSSVDQRNTRDTENAFELDETGKSGQSSRKSSFSS